MSALSSFRSTDQRCWVARWQRRGGSGGGFDYELQKSSHWVNSVHRFGGGGVVVEAAAVDFGCWLVDGGSASWVFWVGGIYGCLGYDLRLLRVKRSKRMRQIVMLDDGLRILEEGIVKAKHILIDTHPRHCSLVKITWSSVSILFYNFLGLSLFALLSNLS